MNIQLIIILFLVFIGIFIKPFSYGVWDFIYKFIVFVGATYLIYKNFAQGSEENKDVEQSENIKQRVIPSDINSESNEPWSLSDLLSEDDSTQQYIKSQFLALAGILIPDQGWIVYKVNEYKLNVIYQISFSDFKLEDIPEQIDLIGLYKIIDERDELLIENNIQNASSSFQYYQDTEYNVSSFLSIPIKISGSEKLFFIFDSATVEQFNKQDTEIIDKIVNGVQSTIKFRLKSISLLSDLKSNKKLLDFAMQINTCNTISTAIDTLAEFVSAEFEAERLTISSTIQDSDKAVIRKVIGQQDTFTEDFEFELEEGLTGWVIGKDKPYIIEDLEKGEYFIPRYTKEEKSNYGLRSFIGIPFSYDDNVYGALTLEAQQSDKYSNYDKQFLEEITNIFSTIFRRKNINKKEI
jgi:transcriptional regulator with GAF, ATPase, and Fis domain